MSFRGTSVEQDCRWGRAEKKLLESMEKNGLFSSILETKVDLKKINIDIMSKWVTERIVQLFGFEDEIVINLIINMLNSPKTLDPKRMQIDITGFLEKKAPSFMEELWTLLCDAQEQPSGIPSVFLEKKKEEILKRQQAQKVRSIGSSDNDLESRSQSSRDQTERRPEEVESKASSDPQTTERERRSRSRDRVARDRSRDRNRNTSNRDRSRERYTERERRVDNRDRDSRNYSGRRERSRSRDGERLRRSGDQDRRRSSRRSPSSSSSSSASSSSSSSSRRSISAERNSRK